VNLPKFNFAEIADFYARQNFERLRDFLFAETPLLNFKFFEMTFTAPTTTDASKKFKHNLGFPPKDLIQTSVTGPSGYTLTWNYSLFDKDFINATITGSVTKDDPVVVRFFLGAYKQ